MRQYKAAVAVGLAVIATGLGSQSAFAFKAHIPILGGQPVHEEITQEAFGFMRPTWSRTWTVSTRRPTPRDIENKVHFDGCMFKEGSEFINSLYHDTIDELDPGNPNADPWQAADDFGYLDPPAQDFYAHSNWVELGRSDLVDAGSASVPCRRGGARSGPT